jgi:hypothetical protein
MAWEQRGDRLYYYRSVRSGSRVTKEYAGGGLMGVLAEDFEAEQREQRTYEHDRRRRERTRWAELEKPARELDDLAELLIVVSLTLAGYHRHDRGEWRRRRGCGGMTVEALLKPEALTDAERIPHWRRRGLATPEALSPASREAVRLPPPRRCRADQQQLRAGPPPCRHPPQGRRRLPL